MLENRLLEKAKVAFGRFGGAETSKLPDAPSLQYVCSAASSHFPRASAK